MTDKVYTYITRGCFVAGTIATLCFDRFSRSAWPTVVLIAAVLISAGVHIYSRFKRVEGEDNEDCSPETASTQHPSEDHSVPAHTTTLASLADKRMSATAEQIEAYTVSQRQYMAALVAQREAFKAFRESKSADEMAIQYWLKMSSSLAASSTAANVGELLWGFYLKRKPLQHSPVEAAVAIAKSMESPDYDVILMPNGEIKISRVSKHSVEHIRAKRHLPLDDLIPERKGIHRVA